MFTRLKKWLKDAKDKRDFYAATRDIMLAHGGDIARVAETFRRVGCQVTHLRSGAYLVTTPKGKKVLLRKDAIVLNPIEGDYE